jgi:hypothetical protein
MATLVMVLDGIVAFIVGFIELWPIIRVHL